MSEEEKKKAELEEKDKKFSDMEKELTMLKMEKTLSKTFDEKTTKEVSEEQMTNAILYALFVGSPLKASDALKNSENLVCRPPSLNSSFNKFSILFAICPIWL